MRIREEITNIIGDFIIDRSLTAEQRADKIIQLFEKLISATEEEVKKHICDDEDSLIDYGVGELADKLREELEK